MTILVRIHDGYRGAELIKPRTAEFAETSVRSEVDRLEKGGGTHFDLVVVLTQLIDIANCLDLNFGLALAEAHQAVIEMNRYDA